MQGDEACRDFAGSLVIFPVPMIQTAVNAQYILQYYRIDVEFNLVAQKYCDSPCERNKSYCISQYIVTRDRKSVV